MEQQTLTFTPLAEAIPQLPNQPCPVLLLYDNKYTHRQEVVDAAWRPEQGQFWDGNWDPYEDEWIIGVALMPKGVIKHGHPPIQTESGDVVGNDGTVGTGGTDVEESPA